MDASSPGAVRDVVIIGSGPAGYTAAVYAAERSYARWSSRGSSTAAR